MTISDGKHSLTLFFNSRLDSLVESGVLKDGAIIWALDVNVQRIATQKVFNLYDAAEAAPNPGRTLGLPPVHLPSVLSEPVVSSSEGRRPVTPDANRDSKLRRLAKGHPWLQICNDNTCHTVSDSLSQCSRCKFVG